MNRRQAKKVYGTRERTRLHLRALRAIMWGDKPPRQWVRQHDGAGIYKETTRQKARLVARGGW